MTGVEPIWIEELHIFTMHDRLLAFHGGASGVRDNGLLQSALARARQLAAYGDSVDVIAMATAITAGIVKNHLFVDGNERTGFVAGILLLKLNGFRFAATESAAADAVLALAAGNLDKAGYTRFLRDSITQE